MLYYHLHHLLYPTLLSDSPLQVKPLGGKAGVSRVVHGDLSEEVRVTASGNQTLQGRGGEGGGGAVRTRVQGETDMRIGGVR